MVEIIGAGFFSFSIGEISLSIANSNTREEHLAKKFAIMDTFCIESKLPV